MTEQNQSLTDTNGTPLWQKPWLTIPEAMRLMRVGRATVYLMLSDGNWTARQVGQRLKISTKSIRDDIDRDTTARRVAAGLDLAA